MGRRAKGPFLDGTEPVEGVDTKDKLFFEKPTLQLVGIEVPEPVTTTYYPRGPTSTHVNMGDEDLRTTIGKCRLMSSRSYQVCSNAPSDKLEYALGQLPTFDEVKEYLRKKRIDGYGGGAIVARRWQNDWRFKHPGQWGIIMYESGNPSPGQKWAPYNVFWFEQSANIQNEKAWAEDLIIIHTHLDESYLQDILYTQGVGSKRT